jgi:hypothetical protein
MLACSIARFKACALRLSANETKFYDPQSKMLFIVPPLYCSVSRINDLRSITDEGSESPRTPNVVFREGPCLSRVDIVSPELVEVLTSTQISRGQELLIDYGSEYTAWDWNMKPAERHEEQ